MADPKVTRAVNPRNEITADYVRSVLDYNPDTGVFLWKARTDVVKPGWWKTKHEGKIAGTPSSSGHIQIRIGGGKVDAARIAFLIMTGEWPEHFMDHKDGNPADNRWDNLRPATLAENNRNRVIGKNNTSGFKGVSWHKAVGKWTTAIRAGGKLVHLGYFVTAEEAHAAYCRAAEVHYGEFASSGVRPKTPSE
jgi:hypothetical protein